jgi:hypothetical protein
MQLRIAGDVQSNRSVHGGIDRGRLRLVSVGDPRKPGAHTPETCTRNSASSGPSIHETFFARHDAPIPSSVRQRGNTRRRLLKVGAARWRICRRQTNDPDLDFVILMALSRTKELSELSRKK